MLQTFVINGLSVIAFFILIWCNDHSSVSMSVFALQVDEDGGLA